MTKNKNEVYDLLVIGGGINGTSIARDATGRDLSVALIEMGDIGWATSSNSTKLLHGGLRYLEYFEFRLVREALQEREILFSMAPHIAWRMRFLFPYKRQLLRPKTAVRAGLFMYDHLAKLKNIQKSKGVNLKTHIGGLDIDLKKNSSKAYEYSDLGTLDTKFCIFNAKDAELRGAAIFTRTKVTKAVRENGIWLITVVDQKTKKATVLKAKALVNTTGPWMNKVIEDVLPIEATGKVNLVQGSHIIVPKMFAHDYGYFLTTDTKRIVFALPFENDFTMIGTTDVNYSGDPAKVKCTKEEKEYLIEKTNAWFNLKLKTSDIVWDFSGVRALFSDGKDATSATRDYVIKVDTDEEGKAPVLNLFGGKITAAREIGEKIMNKMQVYMTNEGSTKKVIKKQLKINGDKPSWTRTTPLYGGEFEGLTFEEYLFKFRVKYPFISNKLAFRLVRHYGTKAYDVVKGVKSMKDLGKHFGSELYEKEIKYMVANEYAQTGEDIYLRRTRLVVHLTDAQMKDIDKYVKSIYK